MGPTAAGKSAVALALAERFAVEIVSVDSALVYRGMDIGTAKPDRQLRARVPHHLIDIRDPAENYSAGEFVRDARAAMEEIWGRGAQPLLVGGTMLYFHALTAGLAELPQADPGLRAALDAEAAQRGWGALHEELRGIDPAAAARIHANDPQRIQRALEVYRLTGERITRLQQRRAPALAGVPVTEIIWAPQDRRRLHARIEARLAAMLAAGFVAEVRALHARGDLTAEHPAMRAVAYRQLWPHVAAGEPLAQAVERAAAATRQLAKRQLTWLRRRLAAHWVDGSQPPAMEQVMALLSRDGFTGRSDT